MGSRLHSRIRGQHGANAAALAAFHPAGTADTPHVMPLALVRFAPSGASVEVMAPIYTPTGRPIPATAPGRWDQVMMAGRP